MATDTIKKMIERGETSLGIELGSTRIKAVLIGKDNMPLASGTYSWENRFEDGYWTYSLDDVWAGLKACYAELASNVFKSFGVKLTTVGAMGVSAMMHGYLPFDECGELLVPFRTWRNTTTGEAAEKLTELFSFNIPLRWSIAHLYQAILNREPHVGRIFSVMTLAGYVHYMLSGRRVVGIGEASGMFPVDSATLGYDKTMLERFDKVLCENGLTRSTTELLPEILPAGAAAGYLTKEGAAMLDPSGTLCPGIPMCPPEGDAGTGMAATNSVETTSGNISAGTSVFAMVVMKRPPAKLHREIDMVATPDGKPVAMIHCNTCTSDIDAWIALLGSAAELLGADPEKKRLYDALYDKALEGDADCGELMAYSLYAGEPVLGLDSGRPIIVRKPESRLTLPNLMRALLNSAFAALAVGMDILKEEGVVISKLYGHGGFFKSFAGLRIAAAALATPISVIGISGEGGAWGMALLASYLKNGEGCTLPQFLSKEVFARVEGESYAPTADEIQNYSSYLSKYKHSLTIEEIAGETVR